LSRADKVVDVLQRLHMVHFSAAITILTATRSVLSDNQQSDAMTEAEIGVPHKYFQYLQYPLSICAMICAVSAYC
jgi:hypothetical protein